MFAKTHLSRLTTVAALVGVATVSSAYAAQAQIYTPASYAPIRSTFPSLSQTYTFNSGNIRLGIPATITTPGLRPLYGEYSTVNGVTVAVFSFGDIRFSSGMALQFTGSYPVVIVSQNDLTLETDVVVSGSNGLPGTSDATTYGGSGGVGGYSGGALRYNAPGSSYPYSYLPGNGPGGGKGTIANGGSFGGLGSGYTGSGGIYGDLSVALQGGSGGGAGTSASGGGGGGAIALIAAKGLYISGWILAGGGSGRNAPFGTGQGSAGGSGGAILLRGDTIRLHNALIDASGGDGSDGSSPATAAGGGGGGRIRIEYRTSYIDGLFSSPAQFYFGGGYGGTSPSAYYGQPPVSLPYGGDGVLQIVQIP